MSTTYLSANHKQPLTPAQKARVRQMAEEGFAERFRISRVYAAGLTNGIRKGKVRL